MKKLFLGILLINLIISVINPLQAKACNCYIPDSALEAMESASAVIQGKVIDLTTESIDNEKYYAALIEVSRIWKGTEDSQIIVYTSWSSCQFEFEIGQAYRSHSQDYHTRF